MNLLHLLGLDTNEVYGGAFILFSLISFLFPYIRWKRNDAWKKDEDEPTKFSEIWRPSALFGTVLFLLIGLAFWFLPELLDAIRPQ